MHFQCGALRPWQMGLVSPSCFLPGPFVSISGSLDVTEIHKPHLGRSTQSDCVSRRGNPTREVAPDSSPERRMSSAVSQHFASRYTYHVSVQASYRRLHATVEGVAYKQSSGDAVRGDITNPSFFDTLWGGRRFVRTGTVSTTPKCIALGMRKEPLPCRTGTQRPPPLIV